MSMKLEDFTARAQGRVSGTINGWPWEAYKTLAKMTEHIYFGCDECTYYGERKCCASCAGNLGFMSHIRPADLPVLAEAFDEKLGFWREGGCIIPRELRSLICVTHNCTRAAYNDAEQRVITALGLFRFSPEDMQKEMDLSKKRTQKRVRQWELRRLRAARKAAGLV